MQQTSGQMKNNKQQIKGGFYMFNKFKHIKNEKGLTLIELLAVIVILAIVAAIAIPAIGNIINNQRDKAILSDISGMVSTAKIAFADGSCTAATATEDSKCTYDGTDKTKNQLDFKSEKIASGTVTFKDSANPTIVVTLATDVGFKGKNEKAFGDLLKTTGGFTETDLNKHMEGTVK